MIDETEWEKIHSGPNYSAMFPLNVINCLLIDFDFLRGAQISSSFDNYHHLTQSISRWTYSSRSIDIPSNRLHAWKDTGLDIRAAQLRIYNCVGWYGSRLCTNHSQSTAHTFDNVPICQSFGSYVNDVGRYSLNNPCSDSVVSIRLATAAFLS